MTTSENNNSEVDQDMDESLEISEFLSTSEGIDERLDILDINDDIEIVINQKESANIPNQILLIFPDVPDDTLTMILLVILIMRSKWESQGLQFFSKAWAEKEDNSDACHLKPLSNDIDQKSQIVHLESTLCEENVEAVSQEQVPQEFNEWYYAKLGRQMFPRPQYHSSASHFHSTCVTQNMTLANNRKANDVVMASTSDTFGMGIAMGITMGTNSDTQDSIMATAFETLVRLVSSPRPPPRTTPWQPLVIPWKLTVVQITPQ